MEFIQEISLELNSNTAYTTIGAKQGDSDSRIIKVHLTQNGQDYIIPDGVSAYFRFRKPDGKVVVNAVTIENNAIYVGLTAQTLAAAGRGYGDITLQSGTQVLSTVSFILIIMASPQVTDQVVSGNEFGYLNAIVGDATNVIYEAESWAKGTRGGAPVVSSNSFIPSFGPAAAVIQSVDVNQNTFMTKVGSTPGLEREYIFTFSENSNWLLKVRSTNGASTSETASEVINSLSEYGITISLYGGVTQPNIGDWIKVSIQEPDQAYNNNAKYYSEQAALSKQAIDDMTVSAETVEDMQHGGEAEVVKTIIDNVVNFHFKIPKGDVGDVNFVGFDIDVNTGNLIMYKPDHVNPDLSFSIVDGDLQMTINN